MITRRGFGLATLMTGAQSAKKPPKGKPVNAPVSLRASVVANGTNAGDPVSVLVDGADTPITANGLAGYLPVTGDRLLVAQVGGQVEVIQFLDKSYIVGQTLKTAPSGNRWEITSDTDPSGSHDVIRGFTGGAKETAPGTIDVGYVPNAYGAGIDASSLEITVPQIDRTPSPPGYPATLYVEDSANGGVVRMNGENAIVGGGKVQRTALFQNEGVTFKTPPSVDDIAAHWGEIDDLSAAKQADFSIR